MVEQPEGSERSGLAVRALARRRNARSQRGELLIETLLAVLVMGTAIAGGMFMLLTMVWASMTHQALARSSNEVTIASEHLERVTYLPCGGATAPTPANYQTELTSGSNPYVAPEGLELDLTVTNVTFLSDSDAATAGFQETCPTDDQGAQRLTVRVEGQGANGKISVRVVYVKRDDRCLGLADTQPGQTC